jgi:hypothetical protein
MKDGADRRPRATIDLVVRVDIRARLCLNVPEGTDFFCWKSSLAIRMPSNDSEVAIRLEKVCSYGYAGIGRALAARFGSFFESRSRS